MDLGLNNTEAFITGSSQGIGLAIAQSFLCEGAKVVITGRRENALRQAEQELLDKYEPSSVLAIQGDMTQPQVIESAVAKIKVRFQRLDAVVANIGSGSARLGWDLTPDEWRQSLNTNFLGSMALVKEAAPFLIQSQPASITFISSIAGIEAIKAPLTYSVSKAALHSAMKSLSLLLGADGVRINAVVPGNIFFPGGTWDRKLSEKKEWVEKYIEAEVPLQRFGRPEEIADAVVYLASNRASFITGASFVIDGGQTRSF